MQIIGNFLSALNQFQVGVMLVLWGAFGEFSTNLVLQVFAFIG